VLEREERGQGSRQLQSCQKGQELNWDLLEEKICVTYCLARETLSAERVMCRPDNSTPLRSAVQFL